MLNAEQIMTHDVHSVTEETAVEALAKLFVDLNKQALPVVDDEGKLVGLVSQNDLIERDKPLHIPTVISLFDWVFYLESEKSFRNDVERMTAKTVGEICRRQVPTCRLDTPMDKVAALMVDEGAHLVPVVDTEERVLGVVARLDLIRIMGT